MFFDDLAVAWPQLWQGFQETMKVVVAAAIGGILFLFIFAFLCVFFIKSLF